MNSYLIEHMIKDCDQSTEITLHEVFEHIRVHHNNPSWVPTVQDLVKVYEEITKEPV